VSAISPEDPAQLPLGETEGAPLVPPQDDPIALGMEAGERSLARTDLASARDAFRAVLALDPNHVKARLRVAQVLDRMGNPDAAVAELDRAITTAPENVALLVGRASLNSARLKYDQAEADLKKAMKLTDSNCDVYTQIGVLLCRRAKWREAIEPLRRAVELDPSQSAPHYHLGEAYNHVDQLDLARSAYERATELDPGNWRAMKGLGVVLDRLSRPVEAAAAYRRSREVQKA
jgi:Tfp pilus assembly protein PilF